MIVIVEETQKFFYYPIVLNQIKKINISKYLISTK